jgi:hypothetical protein
MAFSGSQLTRLGPTALPASVVTFAAKVEAEVQRLLAIGFGLRPVQDKRIGKK